MNPPCSGLRTAARALKTADPMRFILILVAAVVVFVGTIAAALALTGKLNADTIRRLAGIETKAPEVTKQPEDVGPLATKIKEEQERLRAWEADLQKREEQLDTREANL